MARAGELCWDDLYKGLRGEPEDSLSRPVETNSHLGGVNPGANTGAGVNVSKTVGERINFHENGQWSLDKAAMPDKRPIKRGEGGPKRLASQQKVDSKNQALKIKEMQEQIKSGGPSPRKQEEAAYDKIRQKDNDARQQHRAEEDKHNRKVREAFRERQKAKE